MENRLPSISVCVAIHSGSDLDDVIDCIESLEEQEYDDYEILLLSESDKYSESVEHSFSDSKHLRVKNIENEEGGLSEARNEAIELSVNEVILYIDADATADSDLLYQIGKTYRDKQVLAVGGRAKPIWSEGSRPLYIPKEFLWLVGCTHKNHPEHGSVIRSTFGCNISFKREVLSRLNGFNEDLGKNHGRNLQGEEPELGIRMNKEMNSGMYYNSNAVVNHKVDGEQQKLRWLTNRAYLQGYSKSIIKQQTEANLSSESEFMSDLKKSLYNKSKDLVTFNDSRQNFVEIIFILYFTLLVGIGYTVGQTKSTF